jgi:hypothetical protein
MTLVQGKQRISERNLYRTTEVINLILSLAVTEAKLSFQQVKHLGTKQGFVFPTTAQGIQRSYQ